MSTAEQKYAALAFPVSEKKAEPAKCVCLSCMDYRTNSHEAINAAGYFNLRVKGGFSDPVAGSVRTAAKKGCSEYFVGGHYDCTGVKELFETHAKIERGESVDESEGRDYAPYAYIFQNLAAETRHMEERNYPDLETCRANLATQLTKLHDVNQILSTARNANPNVEPHVICFVEQLGSATTEVYHRKSGMFKEQAIPGGAHIKGITPLLMPFVIAEPVDVLAFMRREIKCLELRVGPKEVPPDIRAARCDHRCPVMTCTRRSRDL